MMSDIGTSAVISNIGDERALRSNHRCA